MRRFSVTCFAYKIQYYLYFVEQIKKHYLNLIGYNDIFLRYDRDVKESGGIRRNVYKMMQK